MRHFQNKEIKAIIISLLLGGASNLILYRRAAHRLIHQVTQATCTMALFAPHRDAHSLVNGELEGQIDSERRILS